MTQEQHALKKNALGLSESIVMGIAGTAPAYSIAATTTTLIASVGILSAGSLLYCGMIMFGITLAFLHLNSVKSNAGASYAWVSEVFHPILGFFAGWALLVASAVFMVSGTIPAATATLALISPDRIQDPVSVTLVAAGWLLLVSAIVIKGIKATSYMQVFLTGVEVSLLLIVIISALFQFAPAPVQSFTWNELSITAFTPQTFATGALTGLFFFWGWDVTVNLTEETENAAKTPGRGAVISMIVVLCIFMSFTIAAQLSLSEAEIEAAGTNIIFALAEKVLPHPLSYMAIIAVMLSTVGTLETTMLQFTRTMYAKGRDSVLHPRYSKLHKSWQTPALATGVIASIGLCLLFVSSFYPTVNEIIKDSVNAIGFQVAFYYSLSGFACAWNFRKEGMKSFANFLLLVLWPAVSSCFLTFIAIYSATTFDVTTTVLGLGGIAIGVIPLMLNMRRRAKQKR